LEKDITPKGGAARQKIVIEVRVKIGNSIPYGGSMNRHILWRKLSLLVGLALAATLFLGGCGTDSYTEPNRTRTETPLIEAAQLKEWMDDGLVNADGFEKVLIMQVEPNASKLRIPGACRINTTDITATRFEGLAEAGSMVASGAQMDALIQRLGIDGNTTIVFTTGESSDLYYPTRAYFVFRYWGFPKERLKVLNGGNSAWVAAATEGAWGDNYALTDEAPTPTPSTFSVRNLGKLRDDLRLSINEMITEVVPGVNSSYITIDARGDANWNGTSPTNSLRDTGKVVVFQGRPVGGERLAVMSQIVSGGKYVDGDTARALLETRGWQAGQKVATYCTSGFSCTPLFFVLDALTDIPVQVYDGSWSQWGQYSANSLQGGTLPSATGLRAAWQTDLYTISNLGDVPRYNVADNGRLLADIQDIKADLSTFWGTNGPADPRTNQIEEGDREYITTPPASAPGAFTPGAGGGC
jgi:thiosulfate/3-mercaptopyruvate sulfurtransferase